MKNIKSGNISLTVNILVYQTIEFFFSPLKDLSNDIKHKSLT